MADARRGYSFDFAMLLSPSARERLPQAPSAGRQTRRGAHADEHGKPRYRIHPAPGIHKRPREGFDNADFRNLAPQAPSASRRLAALGRVFRTEIV